VLVPEPRGRAEAHAPVRRAAALNAAKRARLDSNQ
jgi:hypothetical protein